MACSRVPKPLIILGKGAAYAQADEDIRRLVERTGIPYLPMSMAKGLLPDTHPLSAGAARSTVLKDADVVMLVGARLNWLLSHGKGKTWGEAPKKFIHVDIEPRRWTPTSRSSRRWSAISAPASPRCSRRWAKWPAASAEWPARLRKVRRKRRQDGAAAEEQQLADGLSRRPRRAVHKIVKQRPEAIVVSESPNTLVSRPSIVDMYQPRKRIDVGTWGVMGIGMDTQSRGDRDRQTGVGGLRRLGLGSSGMEVETMCR